jgi:tRNA-2-methylthio-N6-dimethylallyladenosine synthase
MNTATPSYYIYTWGCQMNEEDSEQIALYMDQMGYIPAADASHAQVVLLNTCSVRQKPEEKVYSKLGELKELKAANPDMIIGVCGCMAQVQSAQIKRRAPFVDLVIGTGNLAAIPAAIRSIQTLRAHDNNGNSTQSKSGKHRYNTLIETSLPPRKGAIVSDVPLRNLMRPPKLKAHVPIMYGCDKFCTFCIVPHTRGRERSRPTEEILREIRGLAQAGTREITLLGQTVNSYGKNLAEGRVSFARLLEMISEIPGIRRIRFTSPYPRDFTDELIETMARLPKVCRHVHLPIQVADDELLQRMHRGYIVAQYQVILDKLRSAMPDIAITTDIMLGFPGETEEQYQNTMKFVERTRFDAAFMFAYSIRPGTKAAEMPNQVPHKVKIERLNRLVQLQNRITLEINQSHVGEIAEVLVEGRSERNSERYTGFTSAFKTVHFPASENQIGKFVSVKLNEAHLTGFIGEIILENRT